MNHAGAGPYSDLVTCRTPAAVPDVVSGVRLLDHPPSTADTQSFFPSTCLALAWDEPCCNGADIISYNISIEDDIIAVRNATCYVIRDLLADSEYR